MATPSVSTHSDIRSHNTPPTPGPVLIATDATEHADSAITVAKALAELPTTEIQVMTVVAPMMVMGTGYAVIPFSPEDSQAQRDAQLADARKQIARLAGSVNWSISAEIGEPAQTIAYAARTRNARLVVLGRSRHSRMARLLGGDLILRILQIGDTPVLAAAPGLTSLPKRVVIATDLSELSVYAAQIALSYVAPDATIYLVNVRPRMENMNRALDKDWSIRYDQGLMTTFRTMMDTLKRDGIAMETVSLVGNASEEIQEFAAKQNADLIVCGTHGFGFFRRLVLGSVATKLMHEATCSVLCVPGTARARASMRLQHPPQNNTRSFAKSEWDSALSTFSKHNVGRLCTIEIDQAEVGAQIEGRSVPFVGAAYDHADNSVELMFGEQRLAGRHFSNAIRNVTSIDLEVNNDGRDHFLRIANKEGQTLVMLL